MAKTNGKMIANNKKAYHDYFILDTYEAGIALHGTEVKSLGWVNAVLRSHLSVWRMARSISMVCISALMRREIFSIRTPCGLESCFSTSRRLTSCLERRRRRVWRLCPLKYISKAALLKSRLGWQRVRSCMTSGRILPKKTSKERPRGISRCVILGDIEERRIFKQVLISKRRNIHGADQKR